MENGASQRAEGRVWACGAVGPELYETRLSHYVSGI